MNQADLFTFDLLRGRFRPLAADDAAVVPGGLGQHGVTPPASPAVIRGGWIEVIDQLVAVLASSGMVVDQRDENWADGLEQLEQLLAIGPYEPGRVVVGGEDGWQVHDPLPDVPLEQQALTASGYKEV